MLRLLALSSTVLLASTAAAQSVPGARITEYGCSPFPTTLTFDPDTEELYVGSNPPGHTSRVFRIPAGGGPSIPVGPVFGDPDAILYLGTDKPYADEGWILVGNGSSSVGTIDAIDNHGNGRQLFGPSNELRNPGDLTFDRNGRLVVSILYPNQQRGAIFVEQGNSLVQLFTVNRSLMTVITRSTGEILTRDIGGTIRVHSESGTLLDDAYATGLGTAYCDMIFGNGGFWGTDLITLNAATGDLLRIDAAGQQTVIGTGFFGGADGLVFGADGALYMSRYSTGCIFRIEPCETIGACYCVAQPNSTGVAARIAARGSVIAAANDVRLEASRVPAGTFGYFLTSTTQGNTANPAGSQGTLCLGGSIGRYSLSVFQADANGEAALTLDLANTPTPTGTVAVTTGETWNYQGWFRDSFMGGSTSNFTDGVSITYR